jgi:3-oxoadipate enol-lactonase
LSTETAPIETAAWQGFVRHDVQGKAGRLSIRVGGAERATPVLLCHSILTSSAIWHRQAIALAARGYRVLAPDSRGHGHSEAPRGPRVGRRLAIRNDEFCSGQSDHLP